MRNFISKKTSFAQFCRDSKSGHAAEIPYVFNNLAAPRTFPDPSSPHLASASEKDRALAEQLSSYWVNFAKTGDPNGKDLPMWPRFEDRKSPPYPSGPAAVLSPRDEAYEKLLTNLKPAGK